MHGVFIQQEDVYQRATGCREVHAKRIGVDIGGTFTDLIL